MPRKRGGCGSSAAARVMPLGARINAIYSSDIGHVDVVDMPDPLPQAFELVEDGFITDSDFHDFVFGNALPAVLLMLMAGHARS
jgi:hypothetical protein